MKKKLIAPIFVGFLLATFFFVDGEALGFNLLRYTIKAAVAAGLVSINADTTAAQLITSDGLGNDVGVATSGGTTTISLPTASATKRGVLSTTDWSAFNAKAPTTSPTFGTSLTCSYATASTVPYFDASKNLISSAVTPTELGYVSGVTSAIQTQLGTKAPSTSPTFATSSTFSYATASTVPYWDASKNLISSAVTPTELGYVSGVTSALQTQMNLKAPLASPSFTGTVNMSGLTASQAVVTDGSKNLASLGYATADTVSTLVQRDGSGDFTARVVTSDAAAGTVAFRWGNQSDTKPFMAMTGNDTRGIFALTDGSIKIQSTSTSYGLTVGSGSFALSSGLKPILASTDGSVNEESPLWEYNQSTTQTGNTANTLTDLYSISIGGNAINGNKIPLSMEAYGTFAATANVDKQVKVVYGTDVLLDTGSLAVITAVPWHVKVWGRRTGASAMKVHTEFWSGDPTNGPYKSSLVTTSTVTFSTGANLKVQGKGTSASDVVIEMAGTWLAPHN